MHSLCSLTLRMCLLCWPQINQNESSNLTKVTSKQFMLSNKQQFPRFFNGKPQYKKLCSYHLVCLTANGIFSFFYLSKGLPGKQQTHCNTCFQSIISIGNVHRCSLIQLRDIAAAVHMSPCCY